VCNNAGNNILNLLAAKDLKSLSDIQCAKILKIIKLVIQEGVDVNHSNKSYMTPLHTAVRNQNIDILKILL
jgi:ankyrin repeat protein